MSTQLLTRPDGAAFAVIERLGPRTYAWAVFSELFDPELDDEQPPTIEGGIESYPANARFKARLVAGREGLIYRGANQ